MYGQIARMARKMKTDRKRVTQWKGNRKDPGDVSRQYTAIESNQAPEHVLRSIRRKAKQEKNAKNKKLLLSLILAFVGTWVVVKLIVKFFLT